MQEILLDVVRWIERGEGVAVGTVIRTWGSAPRPAGASLALNASGEVVGSVSGGCVERAVVEAVLQALKSGQPQRLHFGVADEIAWQVGLSCGGSIDVFVRPIAPEQVARWQRWVASGESFAAVMVIRGPARLLGLEFFLDARGEPQDAPEEVLVHWGDATAALGRPHTGPVSTPDGEIEFFVVWCDPPPTLVVVGGVHIAIPLVTLAKTLEFRTVVVDPRRMFGSEARFPHVDQLIQAWPDKALTELELTASTAVAVLTHDPKIDDPALLVALRSPAFYVGALGSRKTHARRRQRLLQAGLSDAQLDRIHAPIGLDLGGRSPEEIALAVMAQIVQARRAAD